MDPGVSTPISPAKRAEMPMDYQVRIKRGKTTLSAEMLSSPKRGDIEASTLKQVAELRKKQALPDDWHADVRHA